MSDTATVEPNAGAPAAPAPGQQTIPSSRRAFRKATNTTLGPPPPPAATYSKELGAPPIIAAFDGFHESDDRNDTPSVFLPSHINLMATWYLLCQRLGSHDRFLKDTTAWHPYMDLLYLAFCQYYFILLVRQNKGEFNQNYRSYVDELKEKYPPHLLHIPGAYIQYFMSLTATDSPYQWESIIIPGIPQHGNTVANVADASTPSRAYITATGHESSLNPIHILDVVYSILSHNRTNATDPVYELGIGANRASFFSNALMNDSPARNIINGPLFRTANPASTRAEDAFWFHNVATPTRNAATTPRHSLDLPLRPNPLATNNTSCSILQFLAVVDAPSVQGGNRSTRLRNWPLYYSAVMNFQCQYIAGSRTLNDIAIVGIGANSVVWRYADGILNIREPRSADDDQAIDVAHWRTELAARWLTSLEATATIRDPELEQVALQISLGAQINVDYTGQASGPANAIMRHGPFWTHSSCATTISKDPIPQLAVVVPTIVSSVVRK